MGNFIKGFGLTAFPALAIGIASAVGASSSGGFDSALGYMLLWLLAPPVFIVTLILGLTLKGIRTNKMAHAGALWGIGLGVVGLGATCFSLWNT